MNFSDKENLYLAFLQKWDEQFKKIPYILKYLATYPEITRKIDVFHPINIKSLKDSQLEWVSLVSQFTDPIESNFFKEYWVPIQDDQYSLFIDLSSDSLPIFEIHYFYNEPYIWYKKFIANDLGKFLIDFDDSKFNIDEYLSGLDEEESSQISDLFFQRDELGFAGKLKLEPITKDCILKYDGDWDYSIKGKIITIKGVNSLIIGLLPFDTEISIIKFRAPFIRHRNITEKIRDVKALVYLLQSVGMLSIEYYTISLSKKNTGTAIFKNNKLKLYSANEDLIKGLIEKFQYYKNL